MMIAESFFDKKNPAHLEDVVEPMLDSSEERFLTFINATVVEELGWTSSLRDLYLVEAFLLLLNWIQYIYTFYLLVFVRAVHFNLNTMLIVYGGQYFFSMLSRTILVYYQYMGMEFVDESSLGVIKLANYTRTICLFIAFYILPFLVLERFFATFFLLDYEQRGRPWVPVVLVAVLFPTSIFSAIAYIRFWVPVYVNIISFMALNLAGTVLLLTITRCNISMHKDSYSVLKRRDFRHYSLSERFQLAENIKTCKWLTRVQFSIVFYNILCTSMLLLDQFNFPQSTLIRVYIAFNFCCILYALTIPLMVFYYTPKWINETQRLLKQLRYGRAMTVDSTLRSTFGKEMIYDSKNQGVIYFQRLDEDLAASSMKQHQKELRRGKRHSPPNEYFL
ncbi:unnamed protein product [Caenorhabditis auriculariae]|uniref:Uncharacterized protein n=1 Tax=Caenorhabditis auriculariae TaxID=2777116 RepID=A0A8S1HSG3_9PELO|nr:unnamed protein product [Caenorhabditis auriculariae]